MVRINEPPAGPQPTPAPVSHRASSHNHTHSYPDLGQQVMFRLPPPDYRLIDGWKEPDNRTFEEKHLLALGRLLVILVASLPVIVALMMASR